MLGRVSFWVGLGAVFCAGCGEAEGQGAGGSGGLTNTGGTPVSSGGVSAVGGAVANSGGSPTGGLMNRGGSPAGGVVNSGGSLTGGVMNSGGATSGGKNTGGVSTSGRSAGHSGGVSGDGGTGGVEGGAAGAGGEAGGPGAECGEYLACGCGCCPATLATTRCYYPEAGDDLSELIAKDRALAQDPACEQAGCAAGSHHVCCVRGAGDTTAAGSYRAQYTVSALDRITVSKEGTDGHCSTFRMAMPFNTSINGVHTALELPEVSSTVAWGMEWADDGLCSVGSMRSGAMGAIGSLKFRAVGEACVIDIHLTAFFERNSRIEPIHFDADGVAFEGLPFSLCR